MKFILLITLFVSIRGEPIQLHIDWPFYTGKTLKKYHVLTVQNLQIIYQYCNALYVPLNLKLS